MSSNSDTSATASAPYEPRVVDVLVVKAMLNKALNLPPEIINAITDLAEYWPHTTTEASFQPPVVASGGLGLKENMFLVCPPARTDFNQVAYMMSF
jgi:hypothetical protein